VEVNEVWDPAWTKARISPEGRQALRTFGVSM
jgi:metal-sulfur cluster biosynthetic enzyme